MRAATAARALAVQAVAMRRLVPLLAGAAMAAGCRGPQSMLDPAGPAAAAIARTWWLMASAALAVLLLVLGLLARAMLRRQPAPPMARPERFIVLGGLVLPTVALFALLVYGTLAGRTVIGVGVDTDRVVRVTARQWQWQFEHLAPDGTVLARSLDRLVLPQGEMVEFQVGSEDVIHSFWIPRLGGKVDAIPGRSNRLRLRADVAGAMRGQCAEFCGREHAHMAFSVEVLDPASFAGWLDGRAAGDAGSTP